ncbi:MAG: Type II secretion system protein G precursor [candidate division BRC1 bacterium ADurb.BinA364]|nr:MAG: Type II secretion system protein G precursor [candidate division BRC1 bacterium ADurb.BinA364]
MAYSDRAFTLIELLIVVAIISILAAIAAVNLRQASERALKASDAANLKAIGAALQTYYIDNRTLPPADREAGPFPSHTRDFVSVQNGPAAGGSWDGLPWLLFDLRYISDWQTLFCPKYLKRYRGQQTNRGGWPRYHNFRYAYNSAGLSSGGHLGGTGIMQGADWLARDLWVGPRQGWFGQAYPDYPADYRFPWGEGDQENKLELVLGADMAVRTLVGGTNKTP